MGVDPPDECAHWPRMGPPVGSGRARPTGAKSHSFSGDIIQRAMDNFRRRCEACVAAYGGAFEYFLD